MGEVESGMIADFPSTSIAPCSLSLLISAVNVPFGHEDNAECKNVLTDRTCHILLALY